MVDWSPKCETLSAHTTLISPSWHFIITVYSTYPSWFSSDLTWTCWAWDYSSIKLQSQGRSHCWQVECGHWTPKDYIHDKHVIVSMSCRWIAVTWLCTGSEAQTSRYIQCRWWETLLIIGLRRVACYAPVINGQLPFLINDNKRQG